MNNTKFENMSDLYDIYANFSTKDLKQEQKDLEEALCHMVENPEIMPRLSMVNSLLKEREEKVNE